MRLNWMRKRGAERTDSGALHSSSSASAPASSSFMHRHLGHLRRVVGYPRTRSEKTRLFCLLLVLATLLVCAAFSLVVHLYPSLLWWQDDSADAWLRQHIVCPTDTLLDVPSRRSKVRSADGWVPWIRDALSAVDDTHQKTFAFPVSEKSGIPGQPATVAGLNTFCAARVAEVAPWAGGSWRQWDGAAAGLPSSAANAATADARSVAARFNLTIRANFLENATYAALGSPFCLAGGALYLPPARMHAGGTAVFEAEGLTVLPLTDRVLQQAARSNTSAGLHVVPAMGLVLSGFWIATHFFHLITDALETLYGAFHTLEGGVLRNIPTQTVMVHNRAKSWVNRRGDQPKKMEFSAALANGFSSPLLRNTSPYNTSFLFRPESPYCVGRDGVQLRTMSGVAANASIAGASLAAAAVCFCDGLLVTTHNHPFMNATVYYGVQDWAAQQFGAPPYVAQRSVHAMERLRLTQSPRWAAQFWAEDNNSTIAAPTEWHDSMSAANASAYQPRAVFIHRTTRLIANATKYAAWMREAGFRVEEVFMERLTAAQQYHLGRYADVVVGMHGLGIGHAMWMEREPHGCRTVIEFRPWVIQSMPVQPQRMLGQTMKFRFQMLLPKDVRFGRSVKDPERERELLISVERVNSAFSYPSFTDQTAIYDDAEVRHAFWATSQHLKRCLPQ